MEWGLVDQGSIDVLEDLHLRDIASESRACMVQGSKVEGWQDTLSFLVGSARGLREVSTVLGCSP